MFDIHKMHSSFWFKFFCMKPDCIKSAYVSGFFVKNLETEEIKKCKNIMQKVTPTLRD